MASSTKMNTKAPLLFDIATDYVGVAAIDIGTTFSGFAFSLKAKIDRITMFKNWGAVANIPQAFKTPTCVLLKDKEFHSFGYEARADYSEILNDKDEDDDNDSYEFYEHFKMNLYDEQELSRIKLVKSKDGKHSSTIMQLMAMSIAYLKDKALELLNNQTGGKLTPPDLKWVVTVPAIWSDAAKQFMEEASHQAGLINKDDPSKFAIALEPEAASVKCRTTTVLFQAAESQDFQMPVGTEYLVVDAGGGTLDMTAQRILEDNKMDVLCCANGGPLGGLKVNDNIIELYEQTFGQEAMATYKRDFLSDYIGLLNSIEQHKKSVELKVEKRFNITLSAPLSNCILDCSPGKKLPECIKPEMVNKGVRVRNGLVIFPHAVILEAITKVTDRIVEEVDTLLQRSELAGITRILLVGGFGESKVLQESMKKKFSSEFLVITPEDASTVVLQGAVLYGHMPSVINARTSSKTYAIEYMPLFDPSKHSESRRIETDDGICVKGAVYTLVKKGEVIHRNETRSYFVSPAYAKQPSIPVKLFRSNEAVVTYSDADGVKQVAKCEVALPGSGLDRTAEVKFKFGETQVKIEGRDTKGGEAVETVYSFLTDE